MKIDQNTLDKLEKDIAVAQNYLEGINSAINRDTLVAEEKARNILILTKEEKDVQDRIEWLKEQQISEWVALSAAQEKNKAEMDEMTSRKAKLNAELDDIKQKIIAETESLAKAKENSEKNILSLDGIYKQILMDHETKKAELENELKGIKEKMMWANERNQKEIAFANRMKEEIKYNQSLIDAQAPMLSDMIQKLNQSDWLDKEILDKSAALEIINKNVEISKKELNTKENEKNALESEIIPLRAEKGNIIKAKLIISEKEIELNEKEKYIKDKFQDAGLTY